MANHLRANKIGFGSANNLQEGIRIHPQTTEDYRFIQDYLDKNGDEYNSFAFPEEKKLYIVLRGVLEHWDTSYIKEELLKQGFKPTNVVRWYRPDGQPSSLVLILLPKEDRGKVFNELTEINGVKIRVETQQSKSRTTQCHRCQLFGHSQAKCTAQPKCVKCAGDHLTSTCTKPKDTAATCANCKGSHSASYQGCPKHT